MCGVCGMCGMCMVCVMCVCMCMVCMCVILCVVCVMCVHGMCGVCSMCGVWGAVQRAEMLFWILEFSHSPLESQPGAGSLLGMGKERGVNVCLCVHVCGVFVCVWYVYGVHSMCVCACVWCVCVCGICVIVCVACVVCVCGGMQRAKVLFWILEFSHAPLESQPGAGSLLGMGKERDVCGVCVWCIWCVYGVCGVYGVCVFGVCL